MNDALPTLGLSMMLAWIALPVLAAIASNRSDEPSSRQRALTVALALAACFLLVPWLRVWTHHATALCFSAQTITAALQFAPSNFLLERASAPSLWLLAGAAGALLMGFGFVRALVAALRLEAIVRRAVSAPSWIGRRARELARSMNVAATPVKISKEVAVPFVTGWRRRTIVLPEALLARIDGDCLELVLRHELVHVARRDVELAWLVALARIPFALHPVARWLASEIALAREQAVDVLVAREDPRTYARLLVDVAEHAGTKSCPAPVAMSVSALERRIHRLIGPTIGRETRIGPVIAAAIVFLALAMIAPLRAESTSDRRAELIRCDETLSPAAPAFETESCEATTCEEYSCDDCASE